MPRYRRNDVPGSCYFLGAPPATPHKGFVNHQPSWLKRSWGFFMPVIFASSTAVFAKDFFEHPYGKRIGKKQYLLYLDHINFSGACYGNHYI
jgi:hypothetical protein